MELTKEDIKKIAKLAHLEIRDDELMKYQKDLTGIIKYFDKLSEVNTEAIEPTSNIGSGQIHMREDDSKPGLSPDKALLNAPVRDSGFFSVPKVIG